MTEALVLKVQISKNVSSNSYYKFLFSVQPLYFLKRK